jgi:hypothetical protein
VQRKNASATIAPIFLAMEKSSWMLVQLRQTPELLHSCGLREKRFFGFYDGLVGLN